MEYTYLGQLCGYGLLSLKTSEGDIGLWNPRPSIRGEWDDADAVES